MRFYNIPFDNRVRCQKLVVFFFIVKRHFVFNLKVDYRIKLFDLYSGSTGFNLCFNTNIKQYVFNSRLKYILPSITKNEKGAQIA